MKKITNLKITELDPTKVYFINLPADLNDTKESYIEYGKIILDQFKSVGITAIVCPYDLNIKEIEKYIIDKKD